MVSSNVLNVLLTVFGSSSIFAMFLPLSIRHLSPKAPLSLPELAINVSKRSIQCRSQSRFFSRSTLFQLASKKAPKARPPAKLPATQRPPSSPTTLPKSTALQGPAAQYRSFADTLALRSSPTLLYQSPTQVAFTVASYAFGGFCLVWAGWNFWSTYLYAPEGLSQWVSVGMGGLCFAMSCFGAWIILGVRPHLVMGDTISSLSLSLIECFIP